MGKQVNTGLACLAVGWGWGVADVRGALVSESTWSHFCPVSCDVMGDLYCAGRTYCYGREFEWAPDRWFLLCHCRWIAAGCSAVAAWSRCSAAYGGWSGDSQRSDSVQLGSGCAEDGRAVILCHSVGATSFDGCAAGGRGAGAKPFYRRNGGDRRGGGGCGCA